jgi:hypothetical protein
MLDCSARKFAINSGSLEIAQADRDDLGRLTGRIAGPTEDRLWQGDRRAAQQGARSRQWFYPKDTPRRSAIAKKSAENAAR